METDILTLEFRKLSVFIVGMVACVRCPSTDVQNFLERSLVKVRITCGRVHGEWWTHELFKRQ